MKAFRALLVMSLVFIFAGAACGTGDENTGSQPSENEPAGEENDNNNNETVNNDGNSGEGEAPVEAEGLTFNTVVQEEGDTLLVTMEITNDTEETKRVDFSSGQQFDVLVKDESGNRIYHYAEGKMFTQALITEEVGPGETLTFQDEAVSEQIPSAEGLTVETTLLVYAVDGNEVGKGTFSQSVSIK
ncbi:BsuPI-related putative proteinase inhibitor [Evansella sp. LMS18]|jgi:hypothetical protein|uniref:BsuPI-related putative proteinase inhibitor n=1 Tax=Evansella sp. LMS18 TaxID=2924033 RepID=UPI0020D15BC7|nr:BsuPI-related putative proteinase inhibitor [Evansella sp. LMS18]UTR11170.1 BsuPI-related putative proteinase inhibitor [Evansella sp. LMS18]